MTSFGVSEDVDQIEEVVRLVGELTYVKPLLFKFIAVVVVSFSNPLREDSEMCVGSPLELLTDKDKVSEQLPKSWVCIKGYIEIVNI